jgi:hypothetical protein
MIPTRTRLPNRRYAETADLAIGGMTMAATIGFDRAGNAAEIFLSGGKNGSGLAAILHDAAVLISVALQHGIPAEALARSIARIPESFDAPATVPASPIGAALDLLAGVAPLP